MVRVVLLITWTLASLATSPQPISLCPEVALHHMGVCHAVGAVQFVFTFMYKTARNAV